MGSEGLEGRFIYPEILVRMACLDRIQDVKKLVGDDSVSDIETFIFYLPNHHYLVEHVM